MLKGVLKFCLLCLLSREPRNTVLFPEMQKLNAVYKPTVLELTTVTLEIFCQSLLLLFLFFLIVRLSRFL